MCMFILIDLNMFRNIILIDDLSSCMILRRFRCIIILITELQLTKYDIMILVLAKLRLRQTSDL